MRAHSHTPNPKPQTPNRKVYEACLQLLHRLIVQRESARAPLAAVCDPTTLVKVRIFASLPPKCP